VEVAEAGFRALAAEAGRDTGCAAAQRRLDWCHYGEEMRRLGELLKQIRKKMDDFSGRNGGGGEPPKNPNEG